MSRRKTVFDDVMEMPWPVGVVAAAISFVVFQLFLSKSPDGQLGPAVSSVISTVGWFLTGMFLFAAFFSFVRQIVHGKRFKATRTMADIRSLSWRQFESFIGEYFRRLEYFVVETQEGPDNGVDLVLRKDSEKTYVQCKHWKTNQVGVEKVRELLGSMAAGGAQNGIFVTSGSYTPAARQLAGESGIRLIDGEELVSLRNASDNVMRCPTLLLEQEAMKPECPECGAVMLKRVAKRGANKGNPFWGCSKYPECRGILNVRD